VIGWTASFGEIIKFSTRVVVDVFDGRVFRFFGETLRQAGILILGSAIVIWGLAFILGLQCGIEGAYFSRSVGAPSNAGTFAAWCDLREIMPYAFGYMMSAKVGTGLVAEIGAMRISDEIAEVSAGGYFVIFWMFQNPPDLLFSLIKGMAMATVIVLVGCYYGYTASGGPVGVGTATAKSMVLNTVLVHVVGMLGTQIFWGSNPRAPIGG